MPIIHQNFSMLSGQPRQLNVQLLDHQNQPIVLTHIDNIIWTLHTSSNNAPVIMTKDMSATYGGISLMNQVDFPGCLIIFLHPDDTIDLVDGIYYHQTKLVENILEYIVMTGAVFITDNLEKPSLLFDGELIESFCVFSDNKIFVVLEDNPLTNTEYRVVVTDNIRGMQNNQLPTNHHTFTFTAEYSPLFASFNAVKHDVLFYVDNVQDDSIYRYIRENSIAIRTLTTRTDIDWDNLPIEFAKYVKHKTIYDLVVNSYIQNANNAGKSIKLGDLTVNNQSSGADHIAVLEKLKQNLQPWYDMCLGHTNRGMARSQTVIRSQNQGYQHSYPFPRRLA